MVKRRQAPTDNQFLQRWPFSIIVLAALFALPTGAQPSHKNDPFASPTPKGVGTSSQHKALPDINSAIDSTTIDAVQQDSDGEIWGIKATKRGTLWKWKNSHWASLSFEPAKNLYPLEFQKGKSGSILCLWSVGLNIGSRQKSIESRLISEHRGNTSRVLASWQGNIARPVRLFQSKDATWLTANGTQIYQVQDGEVKEAYTVKQSQMHSALPRKYELTNNSLEVLEDGRGHTWFWSNEMETGYSAYSLRGLLEFDGSKWIHHPNFPGVIDKPYTAVVAFNSQTFWLSVGNGSLFELNTQTLKGKRFAEPFPYAFERVQKIEQTGGAWYLIADTPALRDPNGDYSQRESDLWRWQDSSPTPTSPTKGHFERILHGLDYDIGFSSLKSRPLLATKAGLWIGARSGGAWWMPFDQSHPAVHIDWRRNLFSDVGTLFLQRDGRLLASQWGGTIPDLRPYLAVSPAKTPQTFTTYSSVAEDAHHHLWRVPNLSAGVVEEWDGTRWRRYAIPTAYQLKNFFYLSADARGRVWLLPNDRSQMVSLLDPTKASWQIFPTFPEALQNQLELLGHKPLSRLNIGSGKYLVPRFGPYNRITYRSPDEKLFFFDGNQWHNWTLKDITGSEVVNEYYWKGTPYFNSAGILCANIIEQTWQWTPLKGWTAHDALPHPFAPTPVPTRPPGHEESTGGSPVRDTNGAIWFSEKQQLWKAAWGLCEPQLTPGASHPLLSNNYLRSVLIGPKGTSLLAIGREWQTEYVWMPNPIPDTQLTITPQGQDAFRIRLTALPHTKEKHWFRWRLDEEKWSEPQRESTLLLDFVPTGTHRLEVATINSSLQIDPSPATATLRVTLPQQQQWNNLLSMLNSPDYNQREKAVKVFGRHPMKSLPILWTTRKSAAPDRLWWIDACIQEIRSQPKTR